MIELLRDIQIQDIVDVFIVSLLIYNFLKLITNTRAFQILAGIVILLLPMAISPWYPLNTINWILKNLIPIGIIALIIIFQPEIRKALAHLGRTSPFSVRGQNLFYDDFIRSIDDIILSLDVMAKEKIGAIIVFERTTGLKDYMDTGVLMDAIISRELLISIFNPKSLLHDGAVIISQNRIKAAGCFLPLTDRSDLSLEFGTRHRAAIGITELSDAVSVVISEERGEISYAINGKFYKNAKLDVVARLLKKLFEPKKSWLYYKISKVGGFEGNNN